VQALLRDAERHADVAAARLHDRGVAGDLEQVRSGIADEKILLREVAHFDARVAVLPLEVVCADVGFLSRSIAAVAPPALHRADAVRLGR
jgi:hypothetical protein